MVGGGLNGKKPSGIKKPCGGGPGAIPVGRNSRMEHNNEFTVKIDGEL